MIKVSVILPVYGVAEYIEACVKSLLAQTLEDVEFLFVDDHGSDDSIAI
ncbi:MAG: glycosyltransferase family 2 protein, partial [bacterium]